MINSGHKSPLYSLSDSLKISDFELEYKVQLLNWWIEIDERIQLEQLKYKDLYIVLNLFDQECH